MLLLKSYLSSYQSPPASCLELCQLLMQASNGERKAALQVLLTDPYAAEDLVRSAAWPHFCAHLSAMLSDAEADTALAGAAFLERVLKEARLCDAQSVAELFMALSSHICCTSAGQPHCPRYTDGSALGQDSAGSSAAKISQPSVQQQRQSGPTAKAGGACTSCDLSACGSQATAVAIPVDCRAAGHAPNSTPLGEPVATASHPAEANGGSGVHVPGQGSWQQASKPGACLQQAELGRSRTSQRHAADVCLPGTPEQLGEARAAQLRLLVRCLEALPKLWVCLKAPLMQSLWKSLAPLLFIHPQYQHHGCQATDNQQGACGQARQTCLDSVAGGTRPVRGGCKPGQPRVSGCASRPTPPAAPDIRLAALQGPLLELSLATEATPQHVKSWWQAWTVPVFSTRVSSVESSVIHIMW